MKPKAATKTSEKPVKDTKTKKPKAATKTSEKTTKTKDNTDDTNL